MKVSRREIGSLALASLAGLGGCLGTEQFEVSFVDKKPHYIEGVQLSSSKAIIRFDQLSMDDQIQHATLVSESYGQLNAATINSGISDEEFVFPNDVGDSYTPSVGDTLYIILLEGGETNCFTYTCRHSGGEIIQRVELEVVRSE
jgi:hypothetical protein